MTTSGDETYAALLSAGEPAGPKTGAAFLARLATAGSQPRGASSGVGVISDGSVTGLAHDSRTVEPGNVFFAVPGDHVDGHDFVAQARARGALAAVVERAVPVDVPQLVVDRTLLALAAAACWWYGDPSADLGIVGVTGTDGKTSTSRLVGSVLDAAGLRAGIVSTVGGRIGGVDERRPPHVTTPQAPELQRALAAIRAAGDPVAVVETTSHGLALGRVNGVRYDVAILTNLTREHLEFHGTWEAYREAKRSLFARLEVGPANPPKPKPGWPRTGILNADDPSASLFAETTRAAGAQVLSYGRSPGADLRLVAVDDDGRRLRISWDGPAGRRQAALQLAGRFNAYNALAAAALGVAIGLDPEAVTAGLEDLRHVAGRMQRVELGQPFGVVIDYAHTANALALVLDELAPVAKARGGGLIAVFGSGGERDIEKRGQMGRVAAERCRLVIATNEDPRNEDPMAIIEAIAAGAAAAGAVRGEGLRLILDRHEAVAAAMAAARPGDVVLLAGKGHEHNILVADGGEIPWDEGAAAEAALRGLGFGG
ncbi:MAG: UDP-N-acetylmuramoyl-L-alanyl-D-glutamate--2,6-diaminopimelate ligase [Chloroflexi bacterium]|nr:UDP-N-acetylmuramoyl-L-alanyl-D-glutamate--2,6-diaminopimelate ligase [Chloroflexota bacterium]